MDLFYVIVTSIQSTVCAPVKNLVFKQGNRKFFYCNLAQMIPGKHDFLGSKGHCAEKQEDKESESKVSSKKLNRKHLQV